MLSSITLKNFKSFGEVEIPFKPLTVILGPNGAGKSSLIQALLMLRQSVDLFAYDQAILNGPLTNLGVGRDVLRQGANEEIIEIVLHTTTGELVEFTMGYEADSDTLPLVVPKSLPVELTCENFTYLAAERVGPRLVGPRSLKNASRRDMGARGEGALAVLEHYRADILRPDDPRRAGVSGSLEEVFHAYLERICPTARIELQPYGEVDSIGSSFIFTPPGGLPSLPLRPTNVGFGLSYALPIIVAALVAQPGGVLVVENPEAHLHTVSQRAMTDLLVRTAAAGVQVIVETHSREAFHWIRNKSIKQEIDGAGICINYIQAVYEGGERTSKCFSLMSATDSLEAWPQNFFDEYGSPVDLIAPVTG